MKKKISLLMLLLPLGILAQDKYHQPPEQVIQSFHNDYPHASKEHWTKSHGQWHADFDDAGAEGNGEMVAHYDDHGRHIDSYIPYDRGDVPQPVIDKVEKKYHGGHHFEYTRVESGHQGYFQVQLKYHGNDKTIYVDENGNEHDYHSTH